MNKTRTEYEQLLDEYIDEIQFEYTEPSFYVPNMATRKIGLGAGRQVSVASIIIEPDSDKIYISFKYSPMKINIQRVDEFVKTATGEQWHYAYYPPSAIFGLSTSTFFTYDQPFIDDIYKYVATCLDTLKQQNFIAKVPTHEELLIFVETIYYYLMTQQCMPLIGPSLPE